MNSKNIIKEGFFDDLIRTIIPKSIQKNISKSSQQILKKELEKSNKKIQDLEKQSKVLRTKMIKALEKQYGYKSDKKKVSDFIKTRK
jgi:hypothetical protein